MIRRSLPTQIVVLGWVSLLMDIASDVIQSLLPLYLTASLGASALVVGIIFGVSDATAALVKIVSGTFSDWLGRRKPLLLVGYGLAALAKPLFPLSTGVGQVFVAHFIDRIGKGIRGAPRDALIADLTAPDQRGAAYGLRQSMDTVGAVLGPLIAVALMALSGDNVRATFWFAVLPATLCVLLIVWLVHDSPTTGMQHKEHPSARRIAADIAANLQRLPRKLWLIIAFAALLALARFSDAFLILRGQSLGQAIAWTPGLLALMSAAYAASAFPCGRLFDQGWHRSLLAAGIIFLIAADLVLALGNSIASAFVGAALWGMHMGATQGVLAAMVAEAAPTDLRATAFGCFNFASGIALLAASVMAGALWATLGPAATFLASAVIATLVLPALLHR